MKDSNSFFLGHKTEKKAADMALTWAVSYSDNFYIAP